MLANIVLEIGIGVAGLLLGGVGGWLFLRATAGGTIRLARREAEQLITAAKTEGDAEKQKIELETERQANKRRSSLDTEIADARSEIKKDQARLEKREDNLDSKLDQVAESQSKLDDMRSLLDSQTKELDEAQESLRGRIGELKKRLEEVSGMSTEQAKNQLLEEIRQDTEHDANELIQQIVDEATQNARAKSREITLQAIQRYAAEHVAESTVRSVRIASDDMKGRVIGREGRNIRALEQATGVDILVDDTPGIISVSCFDPIRRAIAGRSLEKLVADGRVHPSRIEEVVESIRLEIGEQIVKEGTAAVWRLISEVFIPKLLKQWAGCIFEPVMGKMSCDIRLKLHSFAKSLQMNLDLTVNLLDAVDFCTTSVRRWIMKLREHTRKLVWIIVKSMAKKRKQC